MPRVPGCRARGGELHMVTAPDGRILGMDGLPLGVDGVHQRQPGREDVVLAGPVEGQPELVERQDRVEVSAVRQVVGHRPPVGELDLAVQGDGEGRHVLERDGLGGAVLHRHLGDDEPRRGVETDGGHRLDDLDHAGLHEDGRDPDGPVPAHREIARHLDVDDPVVAVGAGRRLEDRTAHRRVTARLVHQQLLDVVAVFTEVQPPLVHRRTRDRTDASGDHTGRHALGVRVDGVQDEFAAHGAPWG